MDDAAKGSEQKKSPFHGWLVFAARHGRVAALMVFVFGALVHAVLSHVFSTGYADEIEALLNELNVFQCVPLETGDRRVVAARPGSASTPPTERLRELDVTSVRVLLIERAVEDLGEYRPEAARIVAELLRDNPDLNTRAGAVMALSHMGAEAAPALPELLDTLADPAEDIRLRRLILDKLPAIEPSPEGVVPVLVALHDAETDPRLRAKLAKALGEYGASPAR